MIELFVLLFIWIFEIIARWLTVSIKVTWLCIKGVFKITFSLTLWICKLIIGSIVAFIGLFFPSVKTVKTAIPMTGIEFEHRCAERLMKNGFKNVVVTPPSGDYGADLIAYDRDGNKWVFQCKYYKGKVSNSAVQEIVAAKAHYQANKAAVMTNSKLTAPARLLATENEIILYEMLDD